VRHDRGSDAGAWSLWITEAEVVRLMDIKGAIRRIGDQARCRWNPPSSRELVRRHFIWGGSSYALQLIGATFAEEGILRPKTWAHANCAAPLLIRFTAQRFAQAIIEAFALGQLRTVGSAAGDEIPGGRRRLSAWRCSAQRQAA